MEVIKNKKILALIGIIGLILGTFLPYVTFSFLGYSDSISLWGYWEGKIVLVLTLANALFIFKDWIEKYIPQLFNNNVGRLVEKANNPKFSLIPTILVAVLAIYLFTRIDVDSKYLKYGLGFYSLWIGIISLVGHSIFYKGENKQAIQPQQMQPQQAQQPINYQQAQQSVQPQQSVQAQQSVQPQQMQPQNIANPGKKICPNCGNQVDVNATNCFMCGNRIN